jgi:hypothetical protein
MAVADVEHRDATCEIDILASFNVAHRCVLGVLNKDWRCGRNAARDCLLTANEEICVVHELLPTNGEPTG